LRFSALTDRGASRMDNQDAVFAGPLERHEGWMLLAVADGLGGHANGAWASQRTLELLAETLAGRFDAADPGLALRAAAELLNAAIHREATDQGTPGAATTLVAAVIHEGRFWWCNVGDSRLYLANEGRLEQVSADHSWVEERVREGSLSAASARNHPRRNVVTRTIGFEPEVEADTGGPLELRPGSVLLLCSDGLHGPVDEDDIVRVLLSETPDVAAETLIRLANEAGGPDNISVVVAAPG